jgi:hypothetical protein
MCYLRLIFPIPRYLLQNYNCHQTFLFYVVLLSIWTAQQLQMMVIWYESFHLRYSLRPIILFANVDVSRHILVIDTSVLAKSNIWVGGSKVLAKVGQNKTLKNIDTIVSAWSTKQDRKNQNYKKKISALGYLCIIPSLASFVHRISAITPRYD